MLDNTPFENLAIDNFDWSILQIKYMLDNSGFVEDLKFKKNLNVVDGEAGCPY